MISNRWWTQTKAFRNTSKQNEINQSLEKKWISLKQQDDAGLQSRNKNAPYRRLYLNSMRFIDWTSKRLGGVRYGEGGGVCHWSSDQGSVHGQLLPADRTDRRTDRRRPAAAAAAATATEEKELENATRGNVASSPIFKGKANHRLRCLKGPASFSLPLSLFFPRPPFLSFFRLEPKLRRQSPQFDVSQNHPPSHRFTHFIFLMNSPRFISIWSSSISPTYHLIIQ